MFRHSIFLLTICAGLVAMVVIAVIPVAISVPAAVRGSTLPGVFWLKNLLILSMGVVGLAILIPVTHRLWGSCFRFEITPEFLIATHRLTRARREISWASIAAVSRAAPVFLARSAPVQFSRILIADGTEVRFSHTVSHYAEFVDELRSRLVGRACDPYAPLGSS